MTRGTRSTRQSSRSPNRWGDLIDPLRENGYDPLFAQQRALLAAIDIVPTPNSPAASRRLGDRFSITSEDLDAAVAAAGLFTSPTSPALRSGFPLGSDSERPSVFRRSRSATPAHRRVPVGSTPTTSAQSPTVARGNGGFFDLPVNYFDSSPPRARSVSAVAGGEPSPRYTPFSPLYDPCADSSNLNPPRSPARDAVGRRLDGITETLERLHRRIDWRTDRIDAQLMMIVDALTNQRNGAPAATPIHRKRKRSGDGRNVVDLTGATPSPKKVDFVDLVTDSSWSGSRFSSSESSSSSSDSSSSSSDEDDHDDDKPSTPSKKPKPSPERSPCSQRSPRTPPGNRTPSPPRTPRKAPPRRPPPRTPPRQRAPSVPSTPPAPRKASAASRSPAPQAPRTPPRQTGPAVPATPPAPRRSARVPKPKQQEVQKSALSRVATRGQAGAKKAALKPRANLQDTSARRT